MACEICVLGKMWEVVMAVMIFFSSLRREMVTGLDDQPQVPCYFIFGDSLVDNGNNNLLLTFARANFPPNGIDFLHGPTGRFCNGRNIADISAELLGFKNYIPPYVSSENSNILLGINYASAGAGILSESGGNLGDRKTFDEQLRSHETIMARIVDIFGNTTLAENHLSKCLYYVVFGSNDYINNYYLPDEYSTSLLLSTEEFATRLIEQYHRHILNLYDHGARKIALHGIGPVGCTPNELARHDTNGSQCVDTINTAIQHFNNMLISLVDELNDKTNGNFIYVNLYDIGMEMILNPSCFGLTVIDRSCCGIGQNNGAISCLPLEIPCRNRSDYFFWDAYHPTEVANLIAGGRAYKALRPSDAYPFDIHRLIQP